MPGKGLLRFTRVPLWVGLLAVACAVILGAGAASASSAGNHTVYTDPVGDNEQASSSNYASDIQGIDITSQDNGLVHISVTLSDADARLVSGDELDVFIDYDRKRTTGENGFDLDLYAAGSSSGTIFQLCRLGTLRSCEEGPSGWAHDQPSSTPKYHVVDFYLTMGVAAFDFYARETYKQPGGTTSLHDYAPNSGLLTYETKADPDRDGLFGTADRCPSVWARGKLDRNNNGCPGPFGVIGTREPHFQAALHPSFLHLSDLRVTGVPPGAKVVFSSPRGGDRATANSSGVAHSRRARGDFGYGSVITIRITKPAFVGVFLKVRAQKPQGLEVVRRACIPATGGSAVKCSAALKGS